MQDASGENEAEVDTLSFWAEAAKANDSSEATMSFSCLEVF